MPVGWLWKNFQADGKKTTSRPIWRDLRFYNPTRCKILPPICPQGRLGVQIAILQGLEKLTAAIRFFLMALYYPKAAGWGEP